jgi:hypothetical protein
MHLRDSVLLVACCSCSAQRAPSLDACCYSKGPAKKKSVTRVVGGSVRVGKRNGVRFFCVIFFYRVFELPSPRNAQKRNKRNREKIGFGFLVELFIVCKNLSTPCFLQNVLFGVFELPSLRNTRKRDKTNKTEEKLTSKFWWIFGGKVFDMDFLQKHFDGVFEFPLPRNAPKHTNLFSRNKKVVWWVGGSGI